MSLNYTTGCQIYPKEVNFDCKSSKIAGKGNMQEAYMNRVIHFELISNDPERTAAFYAEVFGWRRVSGEGDYWRLISEENAASDARKGINGATVRPLNEGIPAQTVNTVQVPALAETIAKVSECGGRTLSDIIPLAGIGRFIYCADPEGIPFGLIEYSP
jgi:predicted enzyme related to lactoylglutathione lyase